MAASPNNSAFNGTAVKRRAANYINSRFFVNEEFWKFSKLNSCVRL
jgi:hypothetical protein